MAAPFRQEGVLMKYGPRSTHLAFRSGTAARTARKCLVFVGGLTDGLINATLCGALADACDKHGWSLVNAQLSSCYTGFGVSDLDTDAAELAMLMNHLHQHESCERAVVMGHSTGCQDTVRFMKTYHGADEIPAIVGTILLAPVSDREWLRHNEDDEIASTVSAARRAMECGDPQAIVGRMVGAAITAARCCALYDRGGDDDMFSSDFTDDELQALLNHMSVCPCLMLVPSKDEAVPPHVDIVAHARRMAAAVGDECDVVAIDGATHGCDDHVVDVAAAVSKFLVKLT